MSGSSSMQFGPEWMRKATKPTTPGGSSSLNGSSSAPPAGSGAPSSSRAGAGAASSPWGGAGLAMGSFGKGASAQPSPGVSSPGAFSFAAAAAGGGGGGSSSAGGGGYGFGSHNGTGLARSGSQEAAAGASSAGTAGVGVGGGPSNAAFSEAANAAANGGLASLSLYGLGDKPGKAAEPDVFSSSSSGNAAAASGDGWSVQESSSKRGKVSLRECILAFIRFSVSIQPTAESFLLTTSTYSLSKTDQRGAQEPLDRQRLLPLLRDRACARPQRARRSRHWPGRRQWQWPFDAIVGPGPAQHEQLGKAERLRCWCARCSDRPSAQGQLGRC